MVIFDPLARLFRPPAACGPLCGEVQREVEAQRLAAQFERLADPRFTLCDADRREYGG